jgi:hypothetical protein
MGRGKGAERGKIDRKGNKSVCRVTYPQGA